MGMANRACADEQRRILQEGRGDRLPTEPVLFSCAAENGSHTPQRGCVDRGL